MKSKSVYQSTIILTIVIAFNYYATSQLNRPYRIIKTNEYMDIISSRDSMVLKKLIENEKFYRELSSQNITMENDVSVPIIFHILMPDSELISETTINKQIEGLNQNFNFGDRSYFHEALDSEGFNALQDNIKINFCLAKNDGQPAIFRYSNNTIWNFDENTIFTDRTGLKIIDPKHFLNVVICSLADGVSGYAQMPGGALYSDVIVIDKDYFLGGKHTDHYGQGKTLVHLIGNFFNLKSLWQNDCQDDGVNDTPIHNGPNFECPDYKHVTTCSGYNVEMTMNFMDNTDDQCMSMFTKGQQQRFYASLLAGGPRSSFNNIDNYCDFVLPRNKLTQRVDIFPNPTMGVVNIFFEEDPSNEIKIKIFNAQGVEILSNVYKEKWIKIALPENSKGINYIEISEADKILMTKKILILKH